MASKQKKSPVAEGRSPEEKQSIQKQLIWIGAIVGIFLAAILVLRWGHDSGWGNPDRAVKASETARKGAA